MLCVCVCVCVCVYIYKDSPSGLFGKPETCLCEAGMAHPTTVPFAIGTSRRVVSHAAMRSKENAGEAWLD